MSNEKEKVLVSNKAQCAKCKTIIESTHRHDFKQCPCGAIFVDGGLDYIRRGGQLEDINDLCEYE
jgi:DNA-directed RNA polymerase subunit RPC12/RpoP